MLSLKICEILAQYKLVTLLDVLSVMETIPIVVAVVGYPILFIADVRRLHDFGKGASWAVIFWIFFLGELNMPNLGGDIYRFIAVIYILYLLFKKGDAGPNRYGKAP